VVEFPAGISCRFGGPEWFSESDSRFGARQINDECSEILCLIPKTIQGGIYIVGTSRGRRSKVVE
jgi:hypothetical protein